MKLQNYIRGRIQDLAEDRLVSENDSDRAWMARLMQELDWVYQVHTGEYDKDCVLARCYCKEGKECQSCCQQ